MRLAVHLLTAIALLAGCSDSTSSQNADLATLKRVTSPFRTFSAATAAGWSPKITSCMADQTLGGMGFHYGNTALIDQAVRVDQPELLLYEPQADGSELAGRRGIHHPLHRARDEATRHPCYSDNSSSRTTRSSCGVCTCGPGRPTRAGCTPTGIRR